MNLYIKYNNFEYKTLYKQSFYIQRGKKIGRNSKYLFLYFPQHFVQITRNGKQIIRDQSNHMVFGIVVVLICFESSLSCHRHENIWRFSPRKQCKGRDFFSRSFQQKKKKIAVMLRRDNVIYTTRNSRFFSRSAHGHLFFFYSFFKAIKPQKRK